MSLTSRRVETAGPGRYTDGRGLILVVKPSGARSWVLRYQLKGRRRDMGLGPYPEITLARARDKALEARRCLVEGFDPLNARPQRRQTFKQVAGELIESKRAGWRNAKHASQWTSTLATYAYPRLGELDVQSIDTTHLLSVLKPIWTLKSETASRLRQRIEAVLDFASSIELRSGPNPARWRAHLENLLPKPSQVRPVKHHPALNWKELPQFMTELSKRAGISARALTFVVLTASRSGEVRGMRWSEIDLTGAVWTIPAKRMKANKEHRVPLSPEALRWLGKRGEPSALVFSSEVRLGHALSDMSFTAVLRSMGRNEITVHGFRSTFRDWAGETTGFPREVMEAALAHRLKDKAEAAYARGDLFNKRRELMEVWAEFVVTGLQ